MFPGLRVFVKQPLGDRVERPGANDLVGLWAHVCGKELRVALRIQAPMRADLRRHGTRKPRVKDVGFARKPTRLVALRFVVARCCVGHRIDWQARAIGKNDIVVLRHTLRIEWIPNRDRHTEVTLSTQAPILVQVLGPVAVAVLHVGRMPLDLVALGEHRVPLVDQARKPLARGQVFERAVALFEELHGVLNRFGFRAQRCAVARGTAFRVREKFNHALLRLLHVLARNFGVVGIGGVRLEAYKLGRAERHRVESTVLPNNLPRCEALFAPPNDIGRITKSADHQYARALFGIGQFAREDGYGRVEQRGHRAFAE